MSTRLFLLTLFVAAIVTGADARSPAEWSHHGGGGEVSSYRTEQLSREESMAIDALMGNVAAQQRANPGIFDQDDLDKFLRNTGVVAAERFLEQRDWNVHRAAKLAHSVLTWRKAMHLNKLSAASFPCDLFEMGLIFEFGRSHAMQQNGSFVVTNPVIWIRLGALGGVVKQLETSTIRRQFSYVVNTPRKAAHKVRNMISKIRERHHRHSGRLDREVRHAQRGPIVQDLSLDENATIKHVLRAIAWWLNEWGERNPGTQATLVLDFENTDFAFASWSVGEFLVSLDDMFPSMFDTIIGFRYKAKFWSLHAPISMFNRIFKSRFSSSPETDRKLRFVTEERQIGEYIPRVNEFGATMLPKHVAGYCHGRDSSLAPLGCSLSPIEASEGNRLFDSNLWLRVFNEFYYRCTPVS